MVNIKCEHPVIIENPYLKYLVSKHQVCYLGDHWLNLAPLDHLHDALSEDIQASAFDEKYFCGKVSRNRFVWSDWNTKYHPLFWKNRTGVTLENIDDFYILTREGETIPIYMVVPCGKCSLCKAKKAQDWQTRCLAETFTSDYPPLFITLTYRNEDLPEDGVNKIDVQKFMKRLRINLKRDYGYSDSLRYVLVAEYGKDTHRAHYHMLLWNMPFISEVGKNSFAALHDYIQDSWSHGWIGLEQCKDCSGKYCMKYLRKECFIPEGQNDTFLLSSRRNGGIGAKFARQFMDYARENPNLASIEIPEKFGDNPSVQRCSVPAYFKRLWFPSLSTIVKQEIRDCVSQFMEDCRTVAYALDICPCDFILDPILYKLNKVEEKFPFCVENYVDAVPEKLHRTDVDAEIRDFGDYARINTPYSLYDREYFLNILERIDSNFRVLKSAVVDGERVRQLLDLHILHSEEMQKYALAADVVNIADEVARVERENVRLQSATRSDEMCHLNQIEYLSDVLA